MLHQKIDFAYWFYPVPRQFIYYIDTVLGILGWVVCVPNSLHGFILYSIFWLSKKLKLSYFDREDETPIVREFVDQFLLEHEE
jgi:hypothetical protein